MISPQFMFSGAAIRVKLATKREKMLHTPRNDLSSVIFVGVLEFRNESVM